MKMMETTKTNAYFSSLYNDAFPTLSEAYQNEKYVFQVSNNEKRYSSSSKKLPVTNEDCTSIIQSETKSSIYMKENHIQGEMPHILDINTDNIYIESTGQVSQHHKSDQYFSTQPIYTNEMYNTIMNASNIIYNAETSLHEASDACHDEVNDSIGSHDIGSMIKSDYTNKTTETNQLPSVKSDAYAYDSDVINPVKPQMVSGQQRASIIIQNNDNEAHTVQMLSGPTHAEKQSFNPHSSKPLIKSTFNKAKWYGKQPPKKSAFHDTFSVIQNTNRHYMNTSYLDDSIQTTKGVQNRYCKTKDAYYNNTESPRQHFNPPPPPPPPPKSINTKYNEYKGQSSTESLSTSMENHNAAADKRHPDLYNHRNKPINKKESIKNVNPKQNYIQHHMDTESGYYIPSRHKYYNSNNTNKYMDNGDYQGIKSNRNIRSNRYNNYWRGRDREILKARQSSIEPEKYTARHSNFHRGLCFPLNKLCLYPIGDGVYITREKQISNRSDMAKQRVAGVDVYRLHDGCLVPRIEGTGLLHILFNCIIAENSNMIPKQGSAYENQKHTTHNEIEESSEPQDISKEYKEVINILAKHDEYMQLENALLECIKFLYIEGIKPFAGEIAHQMRKRTNTASWLPSEIVGLAMLCRQTYTKIERRVKGEDGWVVLLCENYIPLQFKGFIDTRTSCNIYTQEDWIYFNRYFISKLKSSNKDESSKDSDDQSVMEEPNIAPDSTQEHSSANGPIFTDGRYALAERLRFEIPRFRNTRLAHLIRMIQIASLSKILTYKEKALVPVATCPVAAKEFILRNPHILEYCTMISQETPNLNKAPEEKPSVQKMNDSLTGYPNQDYISTILSLLRKIVDPEPFGIYLAQLKDMFRWISEERLDSNILGHTKLQDLLLAAPFIHYYRLYTPYNNEHCTYIQSKIYKQPQNTILHTKSYIPWNHWTLPMDYVYDYQKIFNHPTMYMQRPCEPSLAKTGTEAAIQNIYDMQSKETSNNTTNVLGDNYDQDGNRVHDIHRNKYWESLKALEPNSADDLQMQENSAGPNVLKRSLAEKNSDEKQKTSDNISSHLQNNFPYLGSLFPATKSMQNSNQDPSDQNVYLCNKSSPDIESRNLSINRVPSIADEISQHSNSKYMIHNILNASMYWRFAALVPLIRNSDHIKTFTNTAHQETLPSEPSNIQYSCQLKRTKSFELLKPKKYMRRSFSAEYLQNQEFLNYHGDELPNDIDNKTPLLLYGTNEQIATLNNPYLDMIHENDTQSILDDDETSSYIENIHSMEEYIMNNILSDDDEMSLDSELCGKKSYNALNEASTSIWDQSGEALDQDDFNLVFNSQIYNTIHKASNVESETSHQTFKYDTSLFRSKSIEYYSTPPKCGSLREYKRKESKKLISRSKGLLSP